MSVLHENSEYYENKYLKYKAKYLELKQIIGGGKSEKERLAIRVDIRSKIEVINKIFESNGISQIVINKNMDKNTIFGKYISDLKLTLVKVNEIIKLLQKIIFTDNKKKSINTVVTNLKNEITYSTLTKLSNVIKNEPNSYQPVESTSSGKSNSGLLDMITRILP